MRERNCCVKKDSQQSERYAGLHRCIYMINVYCKICVCVCVCVYLCVHQLCLYVCRPILIVAMETECCQRSPDSKRASLSLSVCLSPPLCLSSCSSSSLPSLFLAFSAAFFHLSCVSLSCSLPPHPSSLLYLLLPLNVPPSFLLSHLSILPGEWCAIDY